jgi:hypothetical protein
MIRQRDLPESTLPEAGGLGAGAFLYCRRCGGEFSATRGDYWALAPDAAMTCNGWPGARHRLIALRLVRRECQLIAVEPQPTFVVVPRAAFDPDAIALLRWADDGGPC